MFKFEVLDIWKLSIEFANAVYKVTEKFPEEERFGLTSQVRRSVSSISANIAEGSGSSSPKDFKNFLDISIKSLFETVSHLYLSVKRDYISEHEYQALRQQAEILVKKIKSFKSWLDKNGKF